MGTFEDLVDMIAYCAKNPFIFPSLPGSGKIKVNLGSAKKAETNHKKVVAQEAKDAKKAAAEASKVRQLRHHFGTITYASSHRPHTSLWDSVLGDIRAVCHDLKKIKKTTRPCYSGADWRLHSDVVPASRLQVQTEAQIAKAEAKVFLTWA